MDEEFHTKMANPSVNSLVVVHRKATFLKKFNILEEMRLKCFAGSQEEIHLHGLSQEASGLRLIIAG